MTPAAMWIVDGPGKNLIVQPFPNTANALPASIEAFKEGLTGFTVFEVPPTAEVVGMAITFMLYYFGIENLQRHPSMLT